MRSLLLLLMVFGSLSLVACSTTGDDDDAADDDDAVGDDDDAAPDDDDAADDDDSAEPLGPTTTVRGTVTASATPTGDGVGTLFVGFFDRNYFAETEAELRGEGQFIDVDLSGGGSFDYEIEVAISDEPAWLSCFLDDDLSGLKEATTGDLGAADASSGQPMPLTFPITDENTDYTVDIDLNLVVP
jgi:hypothetical protein